MLSLNATQAAMVALDSKIAYWGFWVYDKNGVEYTFGYAESDSVQWATGIEWITGTAWDAGYSSSTDYVLEEFSGIELRRNMAENRVIVPSEVSFTIVENGELTFSDFKGGSVTIRLFLSDGTDIEQITAWKFRITTAKPGYKSLRITAEDFLQTYLKGYYPNTRLPEEIFPSNRTYSSDGLCVPVPFGTAYVPLRDVFITDAGFIMLGDTTNTYTITKVRNPRSTGLKSEWSSGSYTFTQYTKADADTVNWKVFQAIIADSDNDGTADAHGFWGTPGGPILDPPVQFTRSDTSTMTSPADIIEFVLLDMGVPSAMIDSTSFTAAKAVYTGWSLEFNGAFWYKQPREKVLADLLTQCHSCLQIGEKIELHVLSKTSQKTITGADVLRSSDQGEGSFKYQDIVNQDLSDSGYVTWQVTGEAQDSFLKTLVAADGSTATVISNEVLGVPFVQDSQDVKRIGTLHFQRKLEKEAEVSFTGKGKLLALQPDDVITINDTNYGGSYTVLIDSVKINKDLSIQFQCSKYANAFDDWGDLSPGVVSIASDDTTKSWQPVISGPDGENTNVLKGRLRIGETSTYILLDSDDPIRIAVYDDGTEIVRIGNLNGFLGYITNTFGIAIGREDDYMKYDIDNGIQFSVNTTGVFAGGDTGSVSNVIDYIAFSSLGNATDFGDLTVSRSGVGACASSVTGVFAGGADGGTEYDIIDYIVISTTGNAVDFGDLTVSRGGLGGCSSSTRGLFAGGWAGLYSDTIDYITIATTGNATDFGNLTVERSGASAALSSSTRGVFGGGYSGGGLDVIDYIVISTTGNATDFGDLTVARTGPGGCSSSTRGVFSGGWNTGTGFINIVDYITIATVGNATDFGDLTVARSYLGACASATLGVFGGGYIVVTSYSDTIDYVTIATTGNATDFGDLTVARLGIAGLSNGHGGLF